jgi:hypothetical protein
LFRLNGCFVGKKKNWAAHWKNQLNSRIKHVKDEKAKWVKRNYVLNKYVYVYVCV